MISRNDLGNEKKVYRVKVILIKNYFGQKFQSETKNFENIFLVKQNFQLKNIFGQKNFWVQKNAGSKKHSGSKKCFGQKIFWLQKYLVQKNYLCKKMGKQLGPNHFRSKNMQGTNKFWVKKKCTKKFGLRKI